MSEYSQESFESNNKSGGPEVHKLKLSIDLLSVRNFSTAANVFVTYELQLKETHSFQSSPPTAIT
jgi:centrosomal protein CEP120